MKWIFLSLLVILFLGNALCQSTPDYYDYYLKTGFNDLRSSRLNYEGALKNFRKARACLLGRNEIVKSNQITKIIDSVSDARAKYEEEQRKNAEQLLKKLQHLQARYFYAQSKTEYSKMNYRNSYLLLKEANKFLIEDRSSPILDKYKSEEPFFHFSAGEFERLSDNKTLLAKFEDKLELYDIDSMRLINTLSISSLNNAGRPNPNSGFLTRLLGTNTSQISDHLLMTWAYDSTWYIRKDSFNLRKKLPNSKFLDNSYKERIVFAESRRNDSNYTCYLKTYDFNMKKEATIDSLNYPVSEQTDQNAEEAIVNKEFIILYSNTLSKIYDRKSLILKYEFNTRDVLSRAHPITGSGVGLGARRNNIYGIEREFYLNSFSDMDTNYFTIHSHPVFKHLLLFSNFSFTIIYNFNEQNSHVIDHSASQTKRLVCTIDSLGIYFVSYLTNGKEKFTHVNLSNFQKATLEEELKSIEYFRETKNMFALTDSNNVVTFNLETGKRSLLPPIIRGSCLSDDSRNKLVFYNTFRKLSRFVFYRDSMTNKKHTLVWDRAKNVYLDTLNKWILSIDYSPDEVHLSYTDSDSIYLFNRKTKKPVFAKKLNGNTKIYFTDDSKNLITWFQDPISERQLLTVYNLQFNIENILAFSSPELQLSIGDKYVIGMYDNSRESILFFPKGNNTIEDFNAKFFYPFTKVEILNYGLDNEETPKGKFLKKK